MPARVYTNEMTVEIPDAWEDRSISVFQSPTFDATKLGLTASREPLRGPLEDFIAKDLLMHSRRLNRFEVIAQGPVTVGGAPAVEAKVHWEHEVGPIYQHFIYMSARGRCLKLAATSLRSLAKECEAVMERLIRTARLREP